MRTIKAHIHTVWPGFSFSSCRDIVSGNLDQTLRLHKLIRAFAVCKFHSRTIGLWRIHRQKENGLIRLRWLIWASQFAYEPAHDKTYKMACAPREDSDQTAPSLIRVFARRNLRSLATYWAHTEYSVQTRRIPRLIWIFAGHQCHFVGFVIRSSHIL